uniref:ATP-dependent DNA helicase n=1 Tax=Octopus bimaculoides TaxID=37653 RepID=A0A0L8GFQ1_OCTBM
MATASSGIAATLLNLRRTTHSRFKLLTPVNCNSTCKISPLDVNGRLLHDARFVIWYEAPMCHRYLFEALNRKLKNVMSNDLIFGSKLTILGGDFRQILPVVRRAQKPSLIGAFGDGRIPNVQRQLHDDFMEIPQQFQVNSKENVINQVYEDLEVNFNNTQWLSSRAILSTKNEEVDKLNIYIIQKFPGETFYGEY